MRLSRMMLICTVASVIAACTTAMNAKKLATTRCKEDPVAGPGLIPLTQSVGYLHNANHGAYRGCITDIAAMQTLATNPTSNQPQDVPADSTCSYHDSTTTVLVGAYQGAGAKDTSAYGDGGTRQRGFIVGRVENRGRCATAPPFSIPAGVVAFWVIDRLHGGTTVMSHFVLQGTDDYLGGHANWTLKTCGHSNNGSADWAMYKVGDPCTAYVTTPPHFPPAADFEHGGPGPRPPTIRLWIAEESMWIVCGSDCCYANGFE